MMSNERFTIQRVSTPSSPLAFYTATGGGDEQTGLDQLPLVLGHSLGSDRHMWNEMLELLPANLTVVLWEQPGHGNSALLTENSPTAVDTSAAIQRGLSDLGIEKAVFAGVSLGGLTTLAFAETYPESTAAFAVLDSGPSSGAPEPWLEKADSVEKDGLEGLADGTMQRWFSEGFANGRGADTVERIKTAFLATSPAGYAQCCRILGNTDLRPELVRAASPALVLTGEEDRGFSPEAAQSLADALPNTVQCVVVPGVKHLTPVEAAPEVASALVALVREHS